MLRQYLTHRQLVRKILFTGFITLPACLTVTTCVALPVDFVQIDNGQAESPVEQGGTDEAADARNEKPATSDDKPEKKAAPPDKAAPANKKPAANEAAAQAAKPVIRQKGFVRKKAAVVVAGAAEAAEEVGEVLGNIIGGLFGGRGAAVQVQMQDARIDVNVRKQFEARYGRHFDQIVRTELHFIRVVCQPTRKEYEVMENDAELVRTKAIEKFALLQQGMNRGNRSNDTDTRKPIAEGLLASVKRNLSPDQIAAYERELLERRNAHKDVAILMTAARLDQKLVLNSEQRAQVTKVLDDNWNPAWGSTGMLMYGGQYFPDVPDTKLAPILTSTQKKALRTVTQRNQVFFGFNIGMNQGVAIADEQWNDEPADAKPDKAGPSSKKATDDSSDAKAEAGAGKAKSEATPLEGSE